jgi:predicted dehydrogenase
MSDQSFLDRRTFLKTASLAGLSLSRLTAQSSGRVLGANDRIQLGVIGVGGRGAGDARSFQTFGEKNNACQIVGVCDVYEKRKRKQAELFQCPGYQDYRELIARPDVDAVIIATPDHWHARMAIDAMHQGKDVYLEKPMCHTNDEIRDLVKTVRETKRVLQVGSQTTSADQWWKARKAIADGMIGQMLSSQGSYHRDSVNGEWNWTIDPAAGPDGKGEDFIDWKAWLGPAPERAYDADRFFRFRKYWDYSGGIATDLFYHVVAPLNICWGQAQFPTKVMASGGIYVFKDEREVPDTFNLLADYAAGHSLILSSSMANSQHVPGLIRGHAGTIVMVDHGKFEEPTDHIVVKPELYWHRVNGELQQDAIGGPDYQVKFGKDEIRIPVDATKSMMDAHIGNFLDCMRTRQKPHLDVETGARAQAVINLAVQSYREGRILYWDENSWSASANPLKS